MVVSARHPDKTTSNQDKVAGNASLLDDFRLPFAGTALLRHLLEAGLPGKFSVGKEACLPGDNFQFGDKLVPGFRSGIRIRDIPFAAEVTRKLGIPEMGHQGSAPIPVVDHLFPARRKFPDVPQTLPADLQQNSFVLRRENGGRSGRSA